MIEIDLMLQPSYRDIKFKGVEEDLKISLFEYGFIIGKVSDYYIVVFELFGNGYHIKKVFDFEFEEIFNEHGEETAKNIGVTVTEWNKQDIQHKLSDLLFTMSTYDLFGYSSVVYNRTGITKLLNL